MQRNKPPRDWTRKKRVEPTRTRSSSSRPSTSVIDDNSVFDPGNGRIISDGRYRHSITGQSHRWPLTDNVTRWPVSDMPHKLNLFDAPGEQVDPDLLDWLADHKDIIELQDEIRGIRAEADQERWLAVRDDIEVMGIDFEADHAGEW